MCIRDRFASTVTSQAVTSESDDTTVAAAAAADDDNDNGRFVKSATVALLFTVCCSPSTSARGWAPRRCRLVTSCNDVQGLRVFGITCFYHISHTRNNAYVDQTELEISVMENAGEKYGKRWTAQLKLQTKREKQPMQVFSAIIFVTTRGHGDSRPAQV